MLCNCKKCTLFKVRIAGLVPLLRYGPSAERPGNENIRCGMDDTNVLVEIKLLNMLYFVVWEYYK